MYSRDVIGVMFAIAVIMVLIFIVIMVLIFIAWGTLTTDPEQAVPSERQRTIETSSCECGENHWDLSDEEFMTWLNACIEERMEGYYDE